MSTTPPSPPSPSSLRLCSGLIEVETLRWLETSLIGLCKSACDPKTVATLIRNEGIKGISIRRVIGFHYLISFDDKSKFEEGQIDNWSWLEKWFCKIEIWTPNSGIKARRC
ncbi:hypothetical protein QQP08_005450 [Theobroma cacao]|nr:hypothetical protein QQP08_005450 [Theobroma cacao]